MSSILYYSNFCEHSKKVISKISKSDIAKKIHFICVDKRVKDPNGKVFIILENGQKIIMPENVTRVPALLLLNGGYNVLYGESIMNYLMPQMREQVKIATQNNMEPMAFGFGGAGSFGCVVSDNYSFLDQNDEDLKATGNGGLRQMHNYVDLNYSNSITFDTPQDETEYKKTNKIPEGLTVEQLQQQRDSDLQKITGGRPPMSI
jgi:hypothetical protein